MRVLYELFEIELPVNDYSGPYQVLAVEENNTRVVFFALQVDSTNNTVKDWVPTPLPKPLRDNMVLLDEIAQSFHEKGYEFAYKDDLTIH